VERWEVISELIKNKLHNNLGAEIGVWKGQTTEYLLKRFKGLKIHCIDPYKIYPHYAIYHSLGEYSTQTGMNRLYGKVRSRLKKFGNRCIWSRKESIVAVKQVKENSLDFVFIDANYGYEYVKEDIRAWLPKVRIGGVIIGQNIDSNKDSPLSVQRAVEHYFGKDYRVMSRRWYHIKKEDSMQLRKRKTDVKVVKNKTAYKKPPKAKVIEMPEMIGDFFRSLDKKIRTFYYVKSEDSLAKEKSRYDVIYAEGLLENIKHCNKAMWDMIRITQYKGYVACVVEVGTDKVDDFHNRVYFQDRFLPKFGFGIMLCEQIGNKIYFIGQTG